MRWELVREWLGKAEEDLRAAEVILAATMPSYGTASFHAQQAAEKAIKALLVRHQQPFDKNHDLGRLLDRAETVSPGIREALAPAVALTQYATVTRYPSGVPPPTRDAAADHVARARSAVERVGAVLAPYLDAEPSAT